MARKIKNVNDDTKCFLDPPEDIKLNKVGFQVLEIETRGRRLKYSESEAKELADDLIKWSRRQDSLDLAIWMRNHRLSWHDINERLCKHYECFRLAIEEVKVVLEANLIEGCHGLHITRNIFLLKARHGFRDTGEHDDMVKGVAQGIAMGFAEFKKIESEKT